MSRVLISAGHTATDPGAIFGDMREADYTRRIAQKVIPHLEAAGADVLGVPLDLPLLQRIQWINNTLATDEAGDICVEIHINDGGKRGLESWFKGEGSNNSQRLATTLVETIAELTGYQNQGAKSEFEHELGSLTFLNRTTPATVILEVLYIDNPEDIQELKDESKLDKLAKAIASAILRYLGKDAEGNELPDDQKPKYENLKSVPHPLRSKALGGTGLNPQLGEIISQGRPQFGNPVTGEFGQVAAGSPALNAPALPQMPGAGLPIAPTRNPGSSFMLDREQRKEMITGSYQKLLGRKPKQNELNYFLNQGTPELDLIKKMAESQEHLDILKATLELKELQEKFDKLNRENMGIKAMVRDQKAMIENLNKLIAHKNQALSRGAGGAVTSSAAALNKAAGPISGPGMQLPAGAASNPSLPDQSKLKPRRTLFERLHRSLVRIFG